MAEAKTQYIVTLIHGTYAHEAKDRAWTLPGSLAEETLKATLAANNEATVQFTAPFVWTGANNHTKRRKAAHKLATSIKK